MPDEPEIIRQQMHETRSALTEKLETLEQQVVGTVAEAQCAVQETVENVKEAVQETVETVKGTVQEGVQSVRRAFDLPHQMNEYPWLFFGGSVALGFLCGRAMLPAPHNRRQDDYFRHGFMPPQSTWQSGRETNGHTESSAFARREEQPAPQEKQHSWFDSLAKSFSSEIDKVKGLAIGVGVGMVRDMLTQAAPENLRHQVGEIMNNLTAKLGGETIREPILDTLSQSCATQERQTHDSWAAESNRGSRTEMKPSQYS